MTWFWLWRAGAASPFRALAAVAPTPIGVSGGRSLTSSGAAKWSRRA